MRKVFAMVLTFVMLASTCFAEGIDATKFSDDELSSLRDAVNSEYDRRFGGKPYSPWYDYGLGATIPGFNEVVGREVEVVPGLNRNGDDRFVEQLAEVTSAEFEMYKIACKEFGYDIDVDSGDMSFEASNSDGHTIRITFLSGHVFVEVD